MPCIHVLLSYQNGRLPVNSRNVYLKYVLKAIVCVKSCFLEILEIWGQILTQCQQILGLPLHNLQCGRWPWEKQQLQNLSHNYWNGFKPTLNAVSLQLLWLSPSVSHWAWEPNISTTCSNLAPGAPEVHINDPLNNLVSKKRETKLRRSHLTGDTPFPKSPQAFFPDFKSYVKVDLETTCKSSQLCQQFQSSWSGLALLVPAQLVTSQNWHQWMNVPNIIQIATCSLVLTMSSGVTREEAMVPASEPARNMERGVL